MGLRHVDVTFDLEARNEDDRAGTRAPEQPPGLRVDLQVSKQPSFYCFGRVRIPLDNTTPCYEYTVT